MNKSKAGPGPGGQSKFSNNYRGKKAAALPTPSGPIPATEPPDRPATPQALCPSLPRGADDDLWVFTGWLTQCSALTLGGSNPDDRLDHAVAVDGLGRPTLRGASLAGALFHTLRRCGITPHRALTRHADEYGLTDLVDDSVLRVWNSHPEHEWQLSEQRSSWRPGLHLRPGVGIRQDTGAAADDHLYDLDTVPAGTRWPLVIELDLAAWRRLSAKADEVDPASFYLALQDWAQGRCWLGRGVARGLGWMRLDDCTVVAHNGLGALTWADSGLYEVNGERRTFDKFRHQIQDGQARAVSQMPRPPAATEPWHLVRLTGTISLGQPREGGWGLDTLSIGGHGQAEQALYLDPDHTLVPSARNLTSGAQDAMLKPLAMLQRVGETGKLTDAEPYIPGSSIRGPMRHQLSRRWRQREPEAVIADPITGIHWSAHGAQTSPENPEADKPDQAEQLFGSARLEPAFNSSRLLVKDALLQGKEWTQMVLHSHAEDEFVTGTFADAKFARLMLVQATFEFEIVIEDKSLKAAQTSANEVHALLAEQGGHGLAIGGGQWRGQGGVMWRVCRHEARFGQPWASAKTEQKP